jgi:predicted NUDIX family phosphoesterase
VETNRAFHQIIPYAILYREGKVLIYKRSKNGNESRLHDLWTLGFGGHIEEVDGVGMEAVRNCFVRELQEEAGITPTATEGEFYIDIDEGVSSYHFGVAKVVTKWQGEFKFNEEVKETKWLTLEEAEKYNLESWTRYSIEHLKRYYYGMFENRTV